jgi:hypothetical protein
MTNPFLHLRAIFFSFTGWVDSNVELIWLRVHLAFTDNAHNFTPYERVQRRGHLFVYDVLFVRRITQEGTRIGLIVAVLLWTENYARRTLIGLLEQRPLTELVKSNESING